MVPAGELVELPEDKESLQALVRAVLLERDGEKQRAEQQAFRAEQEQHRADRLRSAGELAQMLLNFAEALDRKPVNPEDIPPHAEPAEEVRHVRRRKGRRNLACFEKLPVSTHIYELKGKELACPCCGAERREIGQEERWQIEYVPGRFERIHHIRKKYACPACDHEGANPRIETAAKPDAGIEKCLAGPGLLAYIITSKFNDYLPCYRLEDIFERQGFAISRATQSVWCGDVADLVEPLYARMASEVRASHLVATDDTVMPMLNKQKCANARMWVYIGDAAHPYNVFDFTLNHGRDGPKYFLKDYNQTLLADAYGGYNGVVAAGGIVRAGCWAHLRRKIIDAEKTAPEIARDAVARIRALYAVETQARELGVGERLHLRRKQSEPLVEELHEKLLAWKAQLLPRHPMAEAIDYALNQWPELNVFLTDGTVPIDNNVSEQQMKRVVLNRKNSLFVGNPHGGRTAAILSSLTSTCRRHGADPQLYLTQLLINLPGTSIDSLNAWLPDQWKAAQQKHPAALPNSTPRA